MRNLLIATCILLLASCTSTKSYTYYYQMVEPVTSKDLLYENDSIKIAFVIKPQFIQFVLENKMSDGIRINWDETSFSIRGKTYRTIHKETGKQRLTESQPPTTIPPHSFLNDALIPVDKIWNIRSLATGNNVPIILETFPSKKSSNKTIQQTINNLRGAKIVVYLPMYIKNQFVSKYYDIMINDIK